MEYSIPLCGRMEQPLPTTLTLVTCIKVLFNGLLLLSFFLLLLGLGSDWQLPALFLVSRLPC